MSSPESFFDPRLGPILDELLEYSQRGVQPDLKQYEERYPELAVEIRDAFAAMFLIHELAPFSDPATPNAMRSSCPRKLGEYQIIREIGRGGMGIVYEAAQESLNRRVAVKILPQTTVFDDDLIKRFHREAKAAGGLHHKNIVPVFGVGQENNLHFYVMQLIEGIALSELLADMQIQHFPETENPPPGRNDKAQQKISQLTARFFCETEHAGNSFPVNPPREATTAKFITKAGGSSTGSSSQKSRQIAKLCIQVCDALDYAHRQGVLHRDIKPSNLIIDDAGTVWITDFGLAKIGDDDLTNTGDLLGTLRYMPPERLRGWSDPRSDVYSLGLTLYEMLALQPAFACEDRIELLQKIQNEEPRRLSKVNSSVPTDLETIVHKATSKEPGDRYQTAADFEKDLQRFVDGKPILARPNSPARKFWFWCRRNPMLSSACALIAALLVTIAFGSTWFAIQMDSRLADRNQALELADERLCSAYLSQINALKSANHQGRKIETLETIRQVESLIPKGDPRRADLQNSALFALSMLEIQPQVSWDKYNTKAMFPQHGFDSSMSKYAWINNQDQVELIDLVSGKTKTLSLPASSKHSHTELSGDGEYLATLAFHATGNRFVISRLADEKIIFEERVGYTNCNSPIAFSPSGKTVSYFSGNVLSVFNTEDGEFLAEYPTRNVSSIAIAPYADFVLINHMDYLEIFDFHKREVVATINLDAKSFCASFSPSGQYIGAAMQNGVQFWRIEKDGIRRISKFDSVDETNPQDFVAFHPSAPIAITMGRLGDSRVWNVYSGELLLQSQYAINSFSADGLSVGFYDSEYGIGTMQFDQAVECRTIQTPPDDKFFVSVDFSHDESRLLTTSGSSNQEYVWSTKNLELLAAFNLDPTDTMHAFKSQFCPTEDNLIFGCQLDPPVSEVPFFTIQKLQIAKTFLGTKTYVAKRQKKLGDNQFALNIIDFAATLDRYVTSSGRTFTISQWPTSEPLTEFDLEPLEGKDGQFEYRYVSLSADGELLAVSGFDLGYVVVVNQQGDVIFRPSFHFDHRDPANLAIPEFSDDGRYLIISTVRDVRIFSTADWSVLKTIDYDHDNVCHVSTSKDYLAIANNDSVILLDSQTLQQLATLPAPHGSSVSGPYVDYLPMTKFSQSGNYLAVGTSTNKIMIWDIPGTLKRLRALNLGWN